MAAYLAAKKRVEQALGYFLEALYAAPARINMPMNIRKKPGQMSMRHHCWRKNPSPRTTTKSPSMMLPQAEGSPKHASLSLFSRGYLVG